MASVLSSPPTLFDTLRSNATQLVDSFIAASKPLSYDLYAATDVAQLNVFERAWMSWYQYWGNPIIATGECRSPHLTQGSAGVVFVGRAHGGGGGGGPVAIRPRRKPVRDLLRAQWHTDIASIR